MSFFDFLLARLQAQAFGFGFAQIGMKLVEELSDVAGLGTETGARACNDGWIQAEALRDVDAGGGSGNADLQFVGGLERGFVEADRGIEHAWGIRGIDLERSVVRGDDGHAADAAEMSGDGDGESGAFFGIGGGAEFIEQDQRIRGRGAGDEIDVGDVRGKRREILLNRLIVADVGEDGVENRQFGAVGGDGNAGLRHQSEQANGFQRHRFAAGVGAGDDELARAQSHVSHGSHVSQRRRDMGHPTLRHPSFEFDGDGDNVDTFGFEISLEQRVASVVEEQAGFASPGPFDFAQGRLAGAAVPT